MNITRARRLCIIIYAVCLASGCATTRALHAPLEAQRAAVAALSAWQINGKISVRIVRGAKPTTHNANWRLRHQPQRQQLEIYGPFGSGRIRIISTPDSAELRDTRDATGEKTTAATAQALLYQKLGWQLPFAHLEYWLRGLPAPDLPATTELDNAGRLRVLTQNAWRVEYTKYQPTQGLQLPHTLQLRGPNDDDDDDDAATAQPAVQIKLILKRWRGLTFD